MNAYFIQRDGGRLYVTARVWNRVYTEWIKVICRQSDMNISCITSKACIKGVEHLPCLTVGWVHHDSIVLMYIFFVPPHVSDNSL
jgi:hypothetical protein